MSNYIKNVAIVGAGGNSGKFMTQSLLATGKHTITALTRPDSTSKLPEGVKTANVNYDDHSSLVAALTGQDALVITLSTTSPPDTQSKLIRAAGDAGVSWILPNEWAPDTNHPGLCKDVNFFAKLPLIRQEIKDLGKSACVGVTCGFWYEWSLAIPDAYGFDIGKKEVTFFDDGKTLTNTSTWPQVGRAVAALLSLPVKKEEGAKGCLEDYRDQLVYVSSFCISQRDMLDSLLRVTGDKEEEWTIKNEDSTTRWSEGFEAMQKGDRGGFVRYMYTRVFFPDDSGNFEKRVGLANEVLGLPEEDLDEATKVAIERSRNPMW